MQALILVGGKGTRLRPLTNEIPKPAVTLVDRPFLQYMFEWLGRFGVDEIILACGFMPDRMREVLGEGEPGGPRLRYVIEPEPLGTAGAIRFAAEHLDRTFLALNGDSLTDLDLTPLLEQHRLSGAKASLGLYPVEDPSAFGLVLRDEDGWVTDFLEKPQPGTPEAERAAAIASPEVNAGIYVLEPEVLEGIESGRKVSIEREIFPALVGCGLGACRLEGYWQDIGTPERYLAATWDILEGRVETAAPRAADGVLIDADATVSDEAVIGPRAVIGPDSVIEPGAVITNSVVHAGARVGRGVRLDGCIVSPDARIPAQTELDDTVVGLDEMIEV
jgi:mannose-1-phosphate guanylyltransferase